jgi:hypothetical protein
VRRSLILVLLAALSLAGTAHASSGPAQLLGRAVLPAATFAAGPPSGSLLGRGPINGVAVPFSSQPVQGFSAALPAGDGRYWVMPDNGYGSIENSADFDLRVYLIKPDLETAFGGSGTINVLNGRTRSRTGTTRRRSSRRTPTCSTTATRPPESRAGRTRPPARACRRPRASS